MIKFEDDDNLYLRWIRAHPDGFVLNMRRTEAPNYMVLHRGNCVRIAPERSYRAGQFVEREYVKVCAATVPDLETWVAAHGRPDRTFSAECKRCTPRAFPVSSSALADVPSDISFSNDDFHLIFKRSTSPAARAKFLSRMFGIFSEEIVSLWAHDERAPYISLGRPTIRGPSEGRGYTLDFTLRERSTGKVFVAECKCEIEYQNFRYFLLERPEQLLHHKKPAFDALLKVAVRDPSQSIYVGGKRIDVDGAILIWGAATDAGKHSVMQARGFHQVLTITDICRDLMTWSHAGYRRLVAERRQWANEMFTGLLGEANAGHSQHAKA